MNIKKILVISLIIYSLWHLYYLDKYPIIDLDDVWMTEPAWQLLKTGKFSAPMFEGVYGLERSDIYHGRIFGVLQIPFLYFFGLGPYQARIGSLLSGFIVLVITFLLANRLFDKKVAFVATGLLSISGIFIIMSHRARQDMLLVMFLLLSVYLFYLAMDKNSKLIFFVSGMIAGLSIDIHLNGIVVSAILVIIFLVEFKNKKFSEVLNQMLICFLGILVGVFWWIYSHVLVDKELFFLQWRGVVDGEFKAPIFKNLWILEMIKKELKRYFLWFWSMTGHRNMIELIFLVVGIILSFFSGYRNKNKVYLILIVIFLIFVFGVSQKAPYYMILMYPFIMFLFAIGVVELVKRNKVLGNGILIGLLLFYTGTILAISYKYYNCDYNSYLKKVKQYVDDNSIIFGDSILWFGFGKNFYADFSYSYYKKVTNNKVDKFLKEKNVRYIIFSKEHAEKIGLDLSNLNYKKVAVVEDKYFGGGGIVRDLKLKNSVYIYGILE